MINRRTFVKNSGLAIAGSTFSLKKLLDMSDLKNKTALGVQLFSIPHLVDKDLKGTLKLISEIGYKEIEFFGPYSFSAETTINRWEGLKKQLGLNRNAFYGYSVPETAKLLKEYGLKATSIHADLTTMRTNMNQMLEAVAPLGTKYIALPALEGEERKTLDDYKKRVAEFNQLGEQMSEYGISFVYHNHGFEHAEMEGVVPMHYLLQHTDPKYVKFELDIFWMSAAGGEPIEFLKAYPNRFKLMHLKDAREPVRFKGDGGTPDQWMAVFPKMADPGEGIFDLESIIQQASISGVEIFFLERDLSPDPMTTLTNSFKVLDGFIE